MSVEGLPSKSSSIRAGLTSALSLGSFVMYLRPVCVAILVTWGKQLNDFALGKIDTIDVRRLTGVGYHPCQRVFQAL